VIADLMVYGLEVALWVGAAAWAIERVAIWRRQPRRVFWAAAMVLSVAIPIVGVMLPPKAPPRSRFGTRSDAGRSGCSERPGSCERRDPSSNEPHARA